MKKVTKDYTKKKRIPAGLIIMSLIMMALIIFNQGDLYARKVNYDPYMYDPGVETGVKLCNRFYCHSNGKESYRKIKWEKLLLPGQQLDCGTCHDFPPKDDIHKTARTDTCGQSCHTQTIKNRVTTNFHINGEINVVLAEEKECTTCHINSTVPGAPPAAGFDMPVKHTGGNPTDKDCTVCHMEEFREYHQNKQVELKNHSGGPSYSSDQYNQFCLSCHDSGNSLMAPQPFSTGGLIPGILNELISKKSPDNPDNKNVKFWYPHNHMAKQGEGYDVNRMLNESGPKSRPNSMSFLSRLLLTTESTESAEETENTEDIKKTEDKPSSTYNYNVSSILTTNSTRLKAGIMGGGGGGGMLGGGTTLGGGIMPGVAGVAQVPALTPAFATPLMGGGVGMLGVVATMGGGIMAGVGPVLSVLGGGGMVLDPLGGMGMDPSRMGGPLSMVTMEQALVGLQIPMMGMLGLSIPGMGIPGMGMLSPMLNPMMGIPGPMMGIPGPMMGMPGPMMGMPGPMMGMPGPMMGMPGPMMGMPGPMMTMPSPMMGMPSPMMGMPGPMMTMPSPMIAMPGPMMDPKVYGPGMTPSMNNMPGMNNQTQKPTDQTQKDSTNPDDNKTKYCLECHAYENQDYSSYEIINNFYGHFSHQDCRTCHTYHGSRFPGLLKDGINWNRSNKSCSNVNCHAPAHEHKPPLSGAGIFYYLKPGATCNTVSCH